MTYNCQAGFIHDYDYRPWPANQVDGDAAVRTAKFDLAMGWHFATAARLKCPFSRRVEFWMVVNFQYLQPLLTREAQLRGEPRGLRDMEDVNYATSLAAIAIGA